MRIGIVGGLDRSVRELQERARAGGHELEVHTGVVNGASAAASLRSLVARADLVVILTDVNSHNGVRLARRHARRRGRPIRMMRRLGVTQLAAFLRSFHPGDAVAAA